MGTIIYIIFVIFIGLLAKKYNRRPLLWALVSVIITPIIAAVLLLILGKKEHE